MQSGSTENGDCAFGSRKATPSTLRLQITTTTIYTMDTDLPAIHPGEFLAQILTELSVSRAAFAQARDVSPTRVSHVIHGDRPVPAELALLFGKALGQSPQYWLNLQAGCDLAVAKNAIGRQLHRLHQLPQVA
jgi:antitoxin HigA-1